MRDGIVGALSDAVFRAEDLGEALKQVGLKMLEYWMQEAMFKPLVTQGMGIGTQILGSVVSSVAGGIGGSLFGGGANANIGNRFDPGPGLGSSAKGNIFDRAGIVPFSRGGIVNMPTLFPFSRGTGLMGESGPEAILPLSRDSGGRLGVRTEGGGNGGRMESLLGEILGALRNRQQLNATIVDRRNLITREQMEGRDGEQLVMYHTARNRG